MITKTKKNFYILVFFIIILFICLSLSYITYLSQVYSYLGYHLNFNLFKLIETIVIFLFVVFPILRVIYSNSAYFFIIYLFVIFQIVPDSIILFLQNSSRLPLYCTLVPLILSMFFYKIKIKIPHHKKIQNSKLYFLFFIIISFCISIYLNIGLNLNFNILNLTSSIIYEQRQFIHENLNKLNSYLIGPIIYLTCILLITSLLNKKRFLTFISAILLIYMFFQTASRMVLITPVYILFFFYVSRTYIVSLIKFMTILCITLTILLISPSNVLTNIPHALIVHRTIMIQSVIKKYYFENFQHHPQQLNHSIFNKLSHEPYYKKDTAKEIGNKYFKKESHANTGFIGDAYMNFNIIGVIIYSIIFCCVILYLNILKISSRYSGILFSLSILFQNAALTSMFLTNGIAILFITLFIYVKNTSYEK